MRRTEQRLTRQRILRIIIILLVPTLIAACEFESTTDQQYGPVGPGGGQDTTGNNGGSDTTGNNNGGGDTADVAITVTPASATITVGETLQLTGTVTGTTDRGVSWSIQSGPGSISPGGLYTAPGSITGTAEIVTVRGAADADPTVWQNATIVVTPRDPGSGGGGDTAKGNEVCFERDILPIFQSNCAKSGCHDVQSSQHGYTFTSYDGIMDAIRPGRPDNSEAFEKITEDDLDKRMPPPPNTPLNATQISTIRRWILEGARNTICPPEETAGCDTTDVSYSGTIRPTLDRYCVGCHSGSNAPKGINLTIYGTVRTVALDGRLVGVVSHAPGFTPMPYGGNRLPDCEVAQIRAWAREGGREN